MKVELLHWSVTDTVSFSVYNGSNRFTNSTISCKIVDSMALKGCCGMKDRLFTSYWAWLQAGTGRHKHHVQICVQAPEPLFNTKNTFVFLKLTFRFQFSSNSSRLTVPTRTMINKQTQTHTLQTGTQLLHSFLESVADCLTQFQKSSNSETLVSSFQHVSLWCSKRPFDSMRVRSSITVQYWLCCWPVMMTPTEGQRSTVQWWGKEKNSLSHLMLKPRTSEVAADHDVTASYIKNKCSKHLITWPPDHLTTWSPALWSVFHNCWSDSSGWCLEQLEMFTAPLRSQSLHHVWSFLTLRCLLAHVCGLLDLLPVCAEVRAPVWALRRFSKSHLHKSPQKINK